MSRNDETLTGGIGISMPRKDEIDAPPQDTGNGEETLSGGIGTAKTAIHGENKTGETEQAAVREWKTGEVIDNRYSVLGLIGSGGMGSVFRVRHLEWGIDMAVKMPRPEFMADPTARARFLRESRTWVQLGLHPNIVQCWYVREIDGLPRLFMDYHSGGSLKDMIRNGRIEPGDFGKIIDITIQIANGLGYAHANGVIHRDVKPANIMIADDHRLCVTDFSLVKVAGSKDIALNEQSDEGSTALSGGTVTGAMMGTPEYGAPEQWDDAVNADARSDIYSLGVILYEMCCRRRPFDSPENPEPPLVLVGRHKYASVPDPRKYNKDIPSGLSDLIRRCLSKNPGDRPKSMVVLREELQALFKKIVGTRYPGIDTGEEELRAGALNNKAVSLFDLGKQPEALTVLASALKVDPQHLEAVRNSLVLEWIAGKKTDQSVLDGLKRLSTAHGGRAEYFLNLGEIHISRGDRNGALQALQTALKLDRVPESKKRLSQMVFQIRESKQKFPEERRRIPAHRNHVRLISFSPDGKRLLTCGGREKFEIWDIETGNHLGSFGEEMTKPVCGTFSPDARFFAAGMEDGSLKLWQLSSGKCVRIMKTASERVNCVTFTTGGLNLFCGYMDALIRVWQPYEGECVKTLQAHDGPVTNIALAPNNRFIFSGSAGWNYKGQKRRKSEQPESVLAETSLIYRNLQKNEILFSKKGHKNGVLSVDLGAGCKYGLSGGADGLIRLWEMDSGSCLKAFTGHNGPVNFVRFLEKEKKFVSSGHDGTVRIWDIPGGRCLRTFDDPGGEFTAVALDTKRNLLAAGSVDGGVRIISLCFDTFVPPMKVSRIKPLQTMKEDRIRSLNLAEKVRKALLENDISNAVQSLKKLRSIPGFERDPEYMDLWNRTAKKAYKTGIQSVWRTKTITAHKDEVNCISINTDGRFFLSGSSDKSLAMWDTTSGKCIHFFRWYSISEAGVRFRKTEARTDSVFDTCITPDGRHAVSCGYYKNILMWDLLSGACVRIFERHANSVNCAAISPSGNFLLSGGREGMIKLWNMHDGREIRVFTGHEGPVNQIAINPEGTFCLSCGDDAIVRLWEIATGKCVRTYPGHVGKIYRVGFLFKGLLGVTAGADGTIRFWDLISGKKMLVLRENGTEMTCMAISPDQKYCISGGNDRMLRIWRLADGKCLTAFQAHNGVVKSVAFTPDSLFAVSGGADAKINMWKIDWELNTVDKVPGPGEIFHIDGNVSLGKQLKDVKRKTEKKRKKSWFPFFKKMEK